MSWSSSETIQQGDSVIFWLVANKKGVLDHVIISPGKEYNGRFGAFRHADLVGLPYGCRVHSRNNMGFIHLLRPTPELWTLALPHRTQILYLPDIAFITSYLNIRPGSHVLEAGTGSGSFSHSIIRTIGRHGHLYTFEFHQGRAEKARLEFEQHGFSTNVTISHRNVCKDGFDIHNKIDAVFLDLPAPWLAIPHVKQTLRPDTPTRICCFSPCMEQVMKTVSALNQDGFIDIQMYECLVRPHDVNTNPRPLDISLVTQRLKDADVKREQRRLRQIAYAQLRNSAKRKREDLAQGSDNKRIKIDDDDGPQRDAEMQSSKEDAELEDRLADLGQSARADNGLEPPTHVVSRVIPEVRGHTSYLTFAMALPLKPLST